MRHVLRQRTVARRTAHQLHDDPAQPRTAARPRSDGHRRPLRLALEEGDLEARKGKAQAAEEPRRHSPHGVAARRGLHRRHPARADRGRRGAQAAHPDHRRRRHQLRSRSGGLRDSGQRRCAARNPAVHVAHRRRRHRRPRRPRVGNGRGARRGWRCGRSRPPRPLRAPHPSPVSVDPTPSLPALPHRSSPVRVTPAGSIGPAFLCTATGVASDGRAAAPQEIAP